MAPLVPAQPPCEDTGAIGYCEGGIEKRNTGG